ncbi:MAG TPA: hypothetical protein VGF99_02220 [Myxococcota bacterium]
MTPFKAALIGLGVSPADLEALEAWPAYRGLGLAERVYRSGLVSDARLVEAFVGLGAVDATTIVLAKSSPPAALGAFSRALAERHRALPLAVERKRLVVALLDPGDTATLEQLSFICGLVIEPRACRPRVLFEGLAAAYDIAVVRPESAFLEHRRPRRAPADDDAGFDLPPPSTDAGQHVVTRIDSKRFTRPHDASPMARVLTQAAEAVRSDEGDAVVIELIDRKARPSTHGTFDLLSTRPPSRSFAPQRARVDDDALSRLTLPTDNVRARDALPPRALSLLVPPLRCAALFVVNGNLAIGWDARTDDGHLDVDVVRDVLLPLTADSVLRDAIVARRAAIGRARAPTTIERMLFRLLRLPPPRSFATQPVIVGGEVVALLYADSSDSELTDLDLDDLARVARALGDALAPLVAAGALPVPLDRRPTTDR